MTPAERMRRYRARRRNARVDIRATLPTKPMIAALYLWLDSRSEHGLDFAINWVTRALFAYQAGDPIPAAASWVPWTPR